jgi:hypothetical protein
MNSQNFFNDELLEKRVDTFYGYGNYQGKYWFIGMEEAGGGFKDIDNRINKWSDRGKQEIEDIAEYHEAIGYPESFQEGAKLDVPVWRAIIRVVLSAKVKKNIALEDVRKYQIYELGRKDKETCLLDLLPLPSPSLRHWIYSQHSRLPYLYNKQTYQEYCVETRINHISEKIKEYKPITVVFYGLGFEFYWRKITKKITDVEFYLPSEGFLICRNSPTIFVMAKFPRALRNEYFHNIGREVAATLAQK